MSISALIVAVVLPVAAWAIIVAYAATDTVHAVRMRRARRRALLAAADGSPDAETIHAQPLTDRTTTE